MQVTHSITKALLVVYLALLAAISLWPKPVDGGGIIWFLTSEILKFTRSVSGLNWLQYNQLEALANVLLYLPLGLFLVVLLPKLKLWWLLPIPILVSVVAEAIQRFALPARYSTLDDVYNNSLGGVLGVLIAAGIRQLLKLRPSGR